MRFKEHFIGPAASIIFHIIILLWITFFIRIYVPEPSVKKEITVQNFFIAIIILAMYIL